MLHIKSAVEAARRLHHLGLAVPVLLGAGGLPSAPTEATPNCEDLTGVYEVMVNLPGGGPTEIQLDLTQNECEITGFVGARTRTAIKNGTVEASTATFTFETPNQGSGGMLEIEWIITVSGTEVTGTFSHALFGNIPVSGTKVGD